MAINNRSLDPSLQRDVNTQTLGAMGTGENHYVHIAPRAQLVEQIKVSCLGLSGAPHVNFQIERFITGTGVTTIGGFCATLTLAAYGTSGLQTVTYLASMALQAGDAIKLTTGAANAAVADATVTSVVKNLADIRTNFGTSY